MSAPYVKHLHPSAFAVSIALAALLDGSAVAPRAVSTISGNERFDAEYVGAPAAESNLDAPAVALGAGALELFTRGATTTRHDGGTTIEHRSRSAAGWAPEQPIGDGFHSAPAVAATGGGGLAVLALGSDGAIHETTSGSPGTWSAWTSLGGRFTGRPAGASPGPGRVDVFAPSARGIVWTRSAGRVGPRANWTSLGGQLFAASGVSAVATAEQTTVVVRWIDNTVRSRTRTAGSWGAWKALGGQTFSDPAVTSVSTGRLDIYVRGRDDALWHRTAATAWQRLGGVLATGPAATTGAAGLITVAGRGPGAFYSTGTQTAAGIWSGWVKVPAITSPSWNPHVSCWAALATIKQVLGTQVNPDGGASLAGGGFTPGIPVKNSASPPCVVAGVWEYVEIHDVRVRLAVADGLTGDGDTVGFLADPTEPLNHFTQVHVEISEAFKAGGWDPTRPPDNTLIDVQGFVYWDPAHVHEDWHGFTGWELHPLTAWRPAR